MTAKLRVSLALFLMLALSACSKEGINAGEEGGVAFIAMAAMLVLTCVLMWFFLGRND